MRESSCASCSAASGGYGRGAVYLPPAERAGDSRSSDAQPEGASEATKQNWNKWPLWRTVLSPILSRLWPMNAGSDWPSNRALLYAKPLRRR